jgi:putative glutamine amidotransferase
VPFRNAKEEAAGERGKYDLYLEAIRRAGGAPVEVSLFLAPPALAELANSLDGIVLPGSPRDVDIARYGPPKRHPETGEADPRLEETDIALLDDAFRGGKPVLAICYGVQLLNVYRGGTLIQHLDTGTKHRWASESSPEPMHFVNLDAGTRIEKLAGARQVTVNSAHHQAIDRPGTGLRPVALGPDGVIEAVEWTPGPTWVIGVQWHPERMTGDGPGDKLSRALFQELIAAARGVHQQMHGVR